MHVKAQDISRSSALVGHIDETVPTALPDNYINMPTQNEKENGG